MSAFQFGDDFAAYLDAHDSPKGYAGRCWSAWLWLDVDRDDLDLPRSTIEKAELT